MGAYRNLAFKNGRAFRSTPVQGPRVSNCRSHDLSRFILTSTLTRVFPSRPSAWNRPANEPRAFCQLARPWPCRLEVEARRLDGLA